MSILDTWGNIKQYFDKWHKNDYKTLHTGETDKITNRTPDSDFLVKSKAVYDKVNEINTDINNININLDKKCNLNQIAQGSSISLEKTQNGFEINYHSVSDGLMTGKDQSFLRSTGMWLKRSSPRWDSVPEHSTIWVNPILQLVYFYYDEVNCNKIKGNGVTWTTNKTLTADKWFHRVRPVTPIWGASNHAGVHIGVKEDGKFTIRSCITINKDIHLVGSLMWFYGRETDATNEASNTYN